MKLVKSSQASGRVKRLRPLQPPRKDATRGSIRQAAAEELLGYPLTRVKIL